MIVTSSEGLYWIYCGGETDALTCSATQFPIPVVDIIRNAYEWRWCAVVGAFDINLFSFDCRARCACGGVCATAGDADYLDRSMHPSQAAPNYLYSQTRVRPLQPFAVIYNDSRRRHHRLQRALTKRVRLY